MRGDWLNWFGFVHLRQSFGKTVKVTKMSCDVTPRSKSKIEGAPMVPLCLKFGAIPTNIYKFTAFWKKWHASFFFAAIGRHLESVSRTIPVFKHTLAPSEKWPTQEISVRFGPFLSSYRVNIARQSLCQGKGQRSHKAKNRRKHFHGEIGRAISNLVAVLVSDLWAMAHNNWLATVPIEMKQYGWFRHNSIICQEDTKGFV